MTPWFRRGICGNPLNLRWQTQPRDALKCSNCVSGSVGEFYTEYVIAPQHVTLNKILKLQQWDVVLLTQKANRKSYSEVDGDGETLRDDGEFTGNFVDEAWVRQCLMAIIQGSQCGYQAMDLIWQMSSALQHWWCNEMLLDSVIAYINTSA